MTEYTPILLSTLETGDPWTATQAQAAIFNPVAISEIDQTVLDAGVIPAGPWIIEDGSGGNDPIYNSATDGTVANIVTPNFVEGFDYLIYTELSHNDAADQQLQAAMYAETSGAYNSAFDISPNATASEFAVCRVLIHAPYRTSNFHIIDKAGAAVSATNGISVVGAGAPSPMSVNTRSTAQKILRARLSFTAGNIDDGVAWMFKRRRQVF